MIGFFARRPTPGLLLVLFGRATHHDSDGAFFYVARPGGLLAWWLKTEDPSGTGAGDCRDAGRLRVEVGLVGEEADALVQEPKRGADEGEVAHGLLARCHDPDRARRLHRNPPV